MHSSVLATLCPIILASLNSFDNSTGPVCYISKSVVKESMRTAVRFSMAADFKDLGLTLRLARS